MTLILIALVNMANAAPWPRLIEVLPKSDCRGDLSVDSDPVYEITALLDLSHPLVRTYFRLHTKPDESFDHAYHVDLRTLALIYGDQPDLDFRRRKGQCAIEDWFADFEVWPVRTRAHRDAVVRRFVTHLAAIDWSYDHVISGSTVYLKNFRVEHAFATNKLSFSGSMVGRHWDVDDREHAARDLHRRVETLRRRLAGDPQLRETLIEHLSARIAPGNLSQVTARTRRFLSAYHRYLEGLPDPILTLPRSGLKPAR